MDKKKQNLAWASLSKEMRLDIVQLYVEFQDESKGDYINRPFWVSIIRKFETIFGHHNLTSDTEPEEILMVERKKVQDAYKAITSDMRRAVLEELFGDKCLTDKEPSVQVEPKFKVGDIVRVKYPKFCKGEIGIIDEIGSRILEYHLKGNKTLENDYFAEDMLELYTEPETKDNMKEKELNRKALYNALCELETASVKVRKALISMTH